jgi:hypothetical protein
MAAQQPEGRPRSRSVLSFGSQKSNDGSGKIDLTETQKERHARRMTTKADPNNAINEAQPGQWNSTTLFESNRDLQTETHLVAQALEKPTIESLRSMQHRDAYGNIISEEPGSCMSDAMH